MKLKLLQDGVVSPYCLKKRISSKNKTLRSVYLVRQGFGSDPMQTKNYFTQVLFATILTCSKTD